MSKTTHIIDAPLTVLACDHCQHQGTMSIRGVRVFGAALPDTSQPYAVTDVRPDSVCVFPSDDPKIGDTYKVAVSYDCPRCSHTSLLYVSQHVELGVRMRQLRRPQPMPRQSRSVKLTQGAAYSMRDLYWSQGVKPSALTEVFHVSASTVRSVLKRWTWADGPYAPGEPTNHQTPTPTH